MIVYRRFVWVFMISIGFIACDSSEFKDYGFTLEKAKGVLLDTTQIPADNPILSFENISCVEIDGLYWMTENLNADTFANGIEIPEVTDMATWYNLKTPAWCYYDNDPVLGQKFGKLYNWYAVGDSNCLCPKGWEVASLQDWKDIVNYYGGEKTSVLYLNSKEVWEEGHAGNNYSGLSIVPAGYRPTHDTSSDGLRDFDGLTGAVYWSSTKDNLLFGIFERDLAWGIDVGEEETFIANNAFYVGQSVRCVKRKL